MMPQWEFLDFLADAASRLPAFRLELRANVTGLLADASGRVSGVRASSAAGEVEIRAGCVVGCDRRASAVRAAAGLAGADVGRPIDVLWFRVARDPAGEDTSLARVGPGHLVVTIDRGDYWQCAFVIPKGGAEALQREPIEVFHKQAVEVAPVLAPHVRDV